MKKIIFGLMAVSALLTACDPISTSKDFELTNYTEQQISDAISFKVFKDEAFTQPAGPAEGNFVKYTTSPATIVTIVQKIGDSEKILATGASGSFKLSPKRGESNDQDIYVRVVNSDNSVAETKKTVNVWVKSDLDPEYKMLLGEAGVKSWTWDYTAPNGQTCWGNGGASSGDEYSSPRAVGGHWWGVTTPEGLLDQLQHSDTGVATGEESVNAYMTFDEDGNVMVIGGNGDVVRKGTYEIVDFDLTRSSGWQIARLHTEQSAILFPFSINENGLKVKDFDIMYLDPNHMTLVYTKGNGAGSWGEITHWMFKACSPSNDILEGNLKWGWAQDGVECWGNAGNSGAGAAYNCNTVDGKWWGVMKGSELKDQLAHSGGVDYGDADDDAYMTFWNGEVTSYKADGTVIRKSDYKLDIYQDRNAGWEIGKLTAEKGGVLFPFSINEGGKLVTEFDVMYMDGNNMTLVYTKGNGAGSWGEITYWRFAGK